MPPRSLLVLLVALGSCDGADPADTDTDAAVVVDPAPVYDCASSELTWDSWAEGFFTTWCTPCHSGSVTGDMRKGAPLRADFEDYVDVSYFLPAIAIAVAQEDPLDPFPPRMPPGGGVPTATKELLAEWIACGAAEGARPAADPCDVVSVVPGDLVVDAQSTADAFCAAGNAVGGDLILSAAGEIALDCLCEVQGDVSVAGPATAVDLPALVTVTGSVLVSSTASLTTFSANALTAVPGDLAVASNAALVSAHFQALEQVGGAVQVLENPSLAWLELSQIDTVGGGVNLNGNPALLVADLTRVREIGGDLLVRFNDAITDVWWFDSLETVGGVLIIDHNAGLDSLSWFQELRSVAGNLQITENGEIEEIFGFWLLESVGGELLVADNDSLTSLLGMDLLQSTGNLTIARNPLLSELAFPALTTTDVFTLEDDDSLVLLDAFAAVTASGGVVITGNEQLTTFRGMPLLAWMEGGLVLLDNPALTSVGDWTALTEIHGVLRIENDDALLSTEGLEGDLVVETDLLVIGNAGLVDLAGQIGLRIVGGDLVVVDNPLLSQARIDAVVDALTVLGGTATVSGNGD